MADLQNQLRTFPTSFLSLHGLSAWRLLPQRDIVAHSYSCFDCRILLPTSMLFTDFMCVFEESWRSMHVELFRYNITSPFKGIFHSLWSCVTQTHLVWTAIAYSYLSGSEEVMPVEKNLPDSPVVFVIYTNLSNWWMDWVPTIWLQNYSRATRPKLEWSLQVILCRLE